MRRFGEHVRAEVNYRIRPGIYAIILGRGGVLLTHQEEPEPEFQLPGGGIDPGEQPLVALHREVFEETGWRIALERRLGVYARFTYMPEYDLWAEKRCHVCLARAVRRIGPPSETGHSAHWMPFPMALDAVASPGDRYWLGQTVG